MIHADERGVSLQVLTQAGSRKQGILGVHGDRLKVAVHAAPERGKANAELLEVLAEALQIKRQNLDVLSGHSHPRKTIWIQGLTEAELLRKLADFLQ